MKFFLLNLPHKNHYHHHSGCQPVDLYSAENRFVIDKFFFVVISSRRKYFCQITLEMMIGKQSTKKRNEIRAAAAAKKNHHQSNNRKIDSGSSFENENEKQNKQTIDPIDCSFVRMNFCCFFEKQKINIFRKIFFLID